MGVVKRQSIKESIFAFTGIVIGYFAVLWIYPKCLKPEEIGLMRVLVDIATLVMPFVQLGMGATAVKFFPYFRDKEKQHNGFLFYLLVFPLIGFGALLLLYLFFSRSLLEFYQTQSPLLADYLIYTLPIALCLAYFGLLSAWSRSILRIVVPGMIQNVLMRILLVLLVLAYFFKWINLDQFAVGLVLVYALLLLVLIGYIYLLGHLFLKPNFTLFNKKLLKDTSSYALFAILSSVSSIIVLRIDTVMLASMTDLANTGIYAIAMYIGMVIEVPRRSLSAIGAPLAAEAWKNNDLAKIDELYKKTSLNQLIIGALLFVGIWTNIGELFNMIPNSEVYKAGMYVVFFIGLGKLFDMLTGINNEIIITSEYYHFNLYFTIAMAVFNIIANLVLIPKYHILGAAMASMLSLVLFNVIKFVFLYWKFELQPFSLNTAKVLLISLLVFGVAIWLPMFDLSPMAAIVWRSTVIVAIFAPLIWLTNAAPEFKELAIKIWKRLGK